MTKIASYQDYNLIKVSVQNATNEFGGIYNFDECSIGFLFLILSKKFNLQDDEIFESITDTFFLKKTDEDNGPDRGVDAVIIDRYKKVVHLFNFKYYSEKDFDRVKECNFPGGEVNKILSFIEDVYEKNIIGFSGNASNNRLEEKVNEIWRLQDLGTSFKFIIHFVHNGFIGLIESDELRLNNDFKIKYKNEVSYDYILSEDISNFLVNRQLVADSKFRAISNNFFDKIDGGNKALILEISAIDLIRIVSNDVTLRNNPDADDADILNSDTEECIFDDNVRIYLKEKTNVNKNIKKTACDENERSKIFFYNNGVTITCDKIDYQGKRNQVVSLNNFQVVNGGQTIHALKSAFLENSDSFDQITVLCKIYETTDSNFKGKIAEYTNSQNPVRDRDIRSIDLIQIKLERDFYEFGYFYERKKNQHESEEKKKRIDSEKLGQIILSYSLEMPAEAKNKKFIIFGEKYDSIFNDKIIATNSLKLINLYNEIEKRKIENKRNKPYLLHATYYIIFFVRKISNIKSEEKDLIKFYDESLDMIEKVIKNEKNKLKDDYSDAELFKSNRPKEYLTELGF